MEKLLLTPKPVLAILKPRNAKSRRSYPNSRADSVSKTLFREPNAKHRIKLAETWPAATFAAVVLQREREQDELYCACDKCVRLAKRERASELWKGG